MMIATAYLVSQNRNTIKITSSHNRLIITASILLLIMVFAQCSKKAPTEPATGPVSQDSSVNQLDILLTKSDGVWVTDIQGTELRQILNDNICRGAVWSHNKRKIAYSKYDGSAYQIMSMDSNGGNIKQLTYNGVNESEFSWAPNDSFIAFWSNYKVSIINIYDLTSKSVSDSCSFSGPSWSPSGSEVSYATLESIIKAYNVYDGTSRIIKADTSIDNIRGLNWSPDGNWIAFYGHGSNPNYDIFIANTNSGIVVQLTSNSRDDYSPAWSSNSTLLTYEGGGNQYIDKRQIMLVNISTKEISNLTNESTWECNNPIWSPDNTIILFDVSDEYHHLYFIELSTGTISPLQHDGLQLYSYDTDW